MDESDRDEDFDGRREFGSYYDDPAVERKWREASSASQMRRAKARELAPSYFKAAGPERTGCLGVFVTVLGLLGFLFPFLGRTEFVDVSVPSYAAARYPNGVSAMCTGASVKAVVGKTRVTAIYVGGNYADDVSVDISADADRKCRGEGLRSVLYCFLLVIPGLWYGYATRKSAMSLRRRVASVSSPAIWDNTVALRNAHGRSAGLAQPKEEYLQLTSGSVVNIPWQKVEYSIFYPEGHGMGFVVFVYPGSSINVKPHNLEDRQAWNLAVDRHGIKRQMLL